MKKLNFFRWLDEVKNNAPNSDISIILVGNKKDLVETREVTTEEAEGFSSENSLYFLETSAKDNSDHMIEKVFLTLSEDIIKKKEDHEDDGDDDLVQGGGNNQAQKLELREENVSAPEKKKKKKCC